MPAAMPKSISKPVPTRPADEQTELQCTDLTIDKKDPTRSFPSNKKYTVSYYAAENLVVGAYCATGGTPKYVVYPGNRGVYELLIQHKVRGGYDKLDKAAIKTLKPTATASAGIQVDPKISGKLLELINNVTAGTTKAINNYLNMEIDALSPAQIKAARAILDQINSGYGDKVELVEKYLKKIPTKFKPRTTAQEMVDFVVNGIQAQYDRLDQLETEVKQALADAELEEKSKGQTVAAPVYKKTVDLLGAKVREVTSDDPRYADIVKHVNDTRHGARQELYAIFEVCNDNVRQRFDTCKTPSHNRIKYLFHGTNVDRIKSILTMGLSCSKANSAGRLGKGIYFAINCAKSFQYVDPGYRAGFQYMFMARVALGKEHCTPGLYRDHLPADCDSIRGTESHSGRGEPWDEYCVRRDEQVDLAFLLVFKN